MSSVNKNTSSSEEQGRGEGSSELKGSIKGREESSREMANFSKQELLALEGMNAPLKWKDTVYGKLVEKELLRCIPDDRLGLLSASIVSGYPVGISKGLKELDTAEKQKTFLQYMMETDPVEVLRYMKRDELKAFLKSVRAPYSLRSHAHLASKVLESLLEVPVTMEPYGAHHHSDLIKMVAESIGVPTPVMVVRARGTTCTEQGISQQGEGILPSGPKRAKELRTVATSFEMLTDEVGKAAYALEKARGFCSHVAEFPGHTELEGAVFKALGIEDEGLLENAVSACVVVLRRLAEGERLVAKRADEISKETHSGPYAHQKASPLGLMPAQILADALYAKLHAQEGRDPAYNSDKYISFIAGLRSLDRARERGLNAEGGPSKRARIEETPTFDSAAIEKALASC